MSFFKVSVAVSIMFASSAMAADGSKPADGKKPATADAAVKYCIESEPFTGSKLTKTECKTKAEWAREGVNVDQLAKH